MQRSSNPANCNHSNSGREGERSKEGKKTERLFTPGGSGKEYSPQREANAAHAGRAAGYRGPGRPVCALVSRSRCRAGARRHSSGPPTSDGEPAMRTVTQSEKRWGRNRAEGGRHAKTSGNEKVPSGGSNWVGGECNQFDMCPLWGRPEGCPSTFNRFVGEDQIQGVACKEKHVLRPSETASTSLGHDFRERICSPSFVSQTRNKAGRDLNAAHECEII